MRRLKEVPETVLNHLRSEHERALQAVFAGYVRYQSFPVRPVRMRVRRESEDADALETVVIPATDVYVKRGGFLDEDHIDRDAITYSVSGSGTPFPYGHIYQASGHVCLGSIFVPSRISRYCPAQPLETLFLHNDRNTGHGGARLSLLAGQSVRIATVLAVNGITLSKDAERCLKETYNVIKDDSLWLLSAEVYRKKPFFEALRIMGQVYDIVFQKERE